MYIYCMIAFIFVPRLYDCFHVCPYIGCLIAFMFVHKGCMIAFMFVHVGCMIGFHIFVHIDHLHARNTRRLMPRSPCWWSIGLRVNAASPKNAHFTE